MVLKVVTSRGRTIRRLRDEEVEDRYDEVDGYIVVPTATDKGGRRCRVLTFATSSAPLLWLFYMLLKTNSATLRVVSESDEVALVFS